MAEMNAVVVGTGMMGPGIAATLATGEISTHLVSRNVQGAYLGLRRAMKTATAAVEKLRAPRSAAVSCCSAFGWGTPGATGTTRTTRARCNFPASVLSSLLSEKPRAEEPADSRSDRYKNEP
jgi:3-hydroxyacyl-CoA dehydrogenase, NAD binding domain